MQDNPKFKRQQSKIFTAYNDLPSKLGLSFSQRESNAQKFNILYKAKNL